MNHPLVQKVIRVQFLSKYFCKLLADMKNILKGEKVEAIHQAAPLFQ